MDTIAPYTGVWIETAKRRSVNDLKIYLQEVFIVKDFFSKIWNVVVKAFDGIKSGISALIKLFSVELKTNIGRYNIVIATQMLIMLFICVMTFIYGFYSAIYGTAIVLFFNISTRHIYSDAISYFYNETLDKKEEAENISGVEDSDLAEYYNDDEDEIEDFSIKKFLPINQKEVTYIGLLNIVLCVIFDFIFKSKDIMSGITIIVSCIGVVLLDLILDKITKKFSESDSFKKLVASVSGKTAYVASEVNNIKEES